MALLTLTLCWYMWHGSFFIGSRSEQREARSAVLRRVFGNSEDNFPACRRFWIPVYQATCSDPTAQSPTLDQVSEVLFKKTSNSIIKKRIKHSAPCIAGRCHPIPSTRPWRPLVPGGCEQSDHNDNDNPLFQEQYHVWFSSLVVLFLAGRYTEG